MQLQTLLLIAVLCASLVYATDLTNQNLPLEYKGAVKPGETIVFGSDCFQFNKVTLYASASDGLILLDAQQPSSFYCADFYLFVTGTQWFIHSCEMRGNHKWKVKSWNKDPIDAYEDVKQYGLAIFRINLNLWKDFLFIWDFVQIFLNDDPKAIRAFLEKSMKFKYSTRSQGVIHIPEHLIHTGDLLTILKMNKEEAAIAYGSGGRAAHSAVFMRDPHTKKLYVAETTPGLGVHKYEWKTWLELHSNGTLCNPTDCGATWMPIKRDWVKYIDEEAVWKWYHEREGFEYCYCGNFFSVFDSKEFILPYPFNTTYFPLLFGYILERASPAQAKDMLFKAFEQRIPIKVTCFNDVVQYARSKNIDVVDLFVIPEQDDWRYPIESKYPRNGELAVDNRECLQCSGLVVKLWKVSGLLDGVFGRGFSKSINAAEHHPRDLYEIGLYEPIRPDICNVDKLEYCQPLGHHLMFEGVKLGFVSPHANMNEKCGLIWPDFPRTPEMC
ncbi:hypothetical protein RCL1_009081 [Eukaryota sp. TZLM3-RCL]